MTSTPEPVKIAGYRIEGMLGTGGMSRVYAARQLSVDRRVALKIFELGGGGGSQAAARLRREAHLLAKLDHENVVRCIDFGESDGYFYLALELVEGESLKQRLDRSGRLFGKDAAKIAVAVAQALQHAHAKGVVHRDVKPGNILIARDGRVKLSDFGLARTPEDAEITQPGTALGTPQYLSPEQARSPRRAGPQSDVYSLGATLYHMITGEPPHQGETLAEVITAILFEPVTPPEQLVPDLDPALSRIIARAMAKDRSRRYHNVLELNADLVSWLGGQADSTSGISWDDAGAARSNWSRGKRWGVAALVVGVVALVVVTTLAISKWSSSPESTPPRPVATAIAPIDLSDVRSGRATYVEAIHRIESLPLSDSRREPALRELILDAETFMTTAAHGARVRALPEMFRGQFERAHDRFDEDYRSRISKVLGEDPSTIPEPLAAVVAAASLAEHRAIDADVATIRERASAACEALLAAYRESFTAQLASDRLDEADEIVKKVRSDIPQTLTLRFQTAVADALHGGSPDGTKDVTPAADWLASEIAAWEAAALDLEKRRDSRREEISSAACTAIREFAIPDSDPTPIRDVETSLRAIVQSKLGPTAAAIRTRWPEVEAAIGARISEIDTSRTEAAAAHRAEQEADLASSLFDALSKGDLVLANQLAGRWVPARDSDPLLVTLLLGKDDFIKAEKAVLDDFESNVGKAQRIRMRSLELAATLDSVDRAARTLEFTKPNYKVPITDLATDEYESRAGAAATPLFRTLLRLFRGDADGASAAARGHEDEPWFRGASAAIADLASSLAGKARSDAAEADALLAQFEAATAKKDLAAAAAAASKLLSNPRLHHLPKVKASLPELKRARESGQAAAAREKKRDNVREASSGKVEFETDGRVHWSYSFDDPAEAKDFVLPGSEWRVGGGRLSSLSELERVPSGGSIDLFRNRTGITKRLGIQSDRSCEVELELVLPLEPAPGLIGMRVFSTCFLLRTMPGGGGQVNSWLGDLDDFRDYFFDPALGETQPKKRGGGWKSFALERGNRYHVAIESSGGSDAEWILRIEDSEVYRWKPNGEPRATNLEFRTEMPCEIDAISIRGYVAGVK